MPMATIIPVKKPISQMQPAPGSLVTIPEVTWEEFEAILQELGEKRAARIAYSNQTLELNDLISDIVKLLLKQSGRKYEPFGSTTLKQPGTAGIEPDACFYIQNYQRMIGRRRLAPEDPPPDLAIETDVTSKTMLSKTMLDAYEAIGIPELWIYSDGRLTIYLLQAGKYRTSPTNPMFPELPLTQTIPATVERAWQIGSVEALEEFAATL